MKYLLQSILTTFFVLLGFYFGKQCPPDLIQRIPIMDFTFENFSKLLSIWVCYLFLMILILRKKAFTNISLFGIIVSLSWGFGALLFSTLYPFELFKSFLFLVISFGPFFSLVSIELFFTFFYLPKKDKKENH